MFFGKVEPLAQFADVHCRQFSNILVPYLIAESFAIEALAVTLRTFTLSHKLISPLLARGRFVGLHRIAQILNDAVKADEVVTAGVHHVFVDTHVFERAVEYLGHSFLGDVFNGCLQRAFIYLQQCFYLPENQKILVFP